MSRYCNVSNAAVDAALQQLPPTVTRVQIFRGLVHRTSTVLPNNLGRFTGTSYMGLAANGLTGTIPKAAEKMTSIQHLDLSNNMLTGDPPDLSKLAKLTSLLLAGNQLASPPQGLSKLKNLELVTLFDNPGIKTLPQDLAELVRRGNCMVVADRAAVPVAELEPFRYDSPPAAWCQNWVNEMRRTGASSHEGEGDNRDSSMPKVWFFSHDTLKYERTGAFELASCMGWAMRVNAPDQWLKVLNNDTSDRVRPGKKRPFVESYFSNFVWYFSTTSA